MGLKQWAFASAIISGLKYVRKSGKVKELGEQIDSGIDKQFPKRSENIQWAIVVEVLLPLAKYLTREDSLKFQKKLMDIVQEFNVDKVRSNVTPRKRG